ncbi:sensor histidine kinase [Micromonospora yangpuensis]|uniref:histidine kinase n=1 Tax=Micromonospora yangpuensis TaxID=683228 RepID=A0A1C6V6D2_9ACTN|nr:nitrate- and nitrite sensing domain-containing protein [Micromonospora yangpuensis]GGM19191.1 histidine kinase [Micromonospora yangpuensis]SCL61912.1 Signal transduction histidine kinase [Micromonospora yangpuensis]
MNTRDWPIRGKLAALVVTPVAALVALWIFATTLTVGPARDLLDAQTLLDDFGRPGEQVVAELQNERRLSMIYLADDGGSSELDEQRRRTDAAVAELRRRIDGEPLRDAANDLLDSRLDEFVGTLDALPAGRGFIDRRQVDRIGALGLYTGMVTSAFQGFAALATLPDADLNRQVGALTDLGRSRELLAQADALVAGASTAGRYAEGEHTRLVQVIGNQRFLVEGAVAELPQADRASYRRLTEQEAFVRLRTMQDDLVASRARPRVALGEWRSSHDAVQEAMRDFELGQADALAERTVPVAVGVLARLGAAGLLGLVAVLVAVLVALRVGRSLVHRLTSIRAAAQEMADHRLPDVLSRLRRGEDVDIAREAPPLEYGRDEIGAVGRAFNEVGRTAIQAAVHEVTLRRGLNEVFLNIARRSQGLVHRQLAVLDRLERRAEDPDELAELFRVDHLATRLRRHAEDLVILAGAAPGRGWRHPVAVVDLVRGATGEVESYERVDLTTLAPAAALGRAVGDVIHLLAELIENATAFSPPHTRVEVSGRRGPDGYTVEIVDRGLGMTPAAVEEANRRLVDPPDFNPAESARLGLFVVARLAARHGIRVRLDTSEHAGITATVLIPADLITDEPAVSGPSQERMARVTRLPAQPRPRGGRITRERPAASTPVVPLTADRVGPVDLNPDTEGLPRRVRSRGPATRGPRQPVGDTPSPRSPEEMRRIMSALQAGTARGRQIGAAQVRPVDPAATPEPPTTTERDA